jgi:hypothetical protein
MRTARPGRPLASHLGLGALPWGLQAHVMNTVARRAGGPSHDALGAPLSDVRGACAKDGPYRASGIRGGAVGRPARNPPALRDRSRPPPAVVGGDGEHRGGGVAGLLDAVLHAQQIEEGRSLRIRFMCHRLQSFNKLLKRAGIRLRSGNWQTLHRSPNIRSASSLPCCAWRQRKVHINRGPGWVLHCAPEARDRLAPLGCCACGWR